MGSIQTLERLAHVGSLFEFCRLADKKAFRNGLEVGSKAHPKDPGDEQVLTAALVKGLLYVSSCM